MEITRYNFFEKLSEVKDAISKASFITVDGEFTGLTAGHTIMAFDTAAERYQKLRQGSMDFMMIQFGLCIFNYEQETNRYTHCAYNFYIFPKSHCSGAPDPRFLCQSSSIEFLVCNGFDFNKVFQKGISYLNYPEEEKLRGLMEEKQKAHEQRALSSVVSASLKSEMIPIPDEQKTIVEGKCKKIQNFINSSAETLQIAGCNSFQRKLIYQTARQRFKNIHLESNTTEKKEKVILVTKVLEEQKKEKEEMKKKAEAKELEDAVGFSKVIKEISRAGKLVVGHNMLLDVCHMIHHFITPLPTDYEDFKALTKHVFPRLLDTKLMANTYPFREKIPDSSLSNLLKTLGENPFQIPQVEVAEGCSGYSSSAEKLHEAGYDAFITGLCFIAMSQYLGTFQHPPKERVLPESAVIKPFVNKLYLMRLQDIPYMNMAGPEITPDRDHIFYVTFPKFWQHSDLTQLFSPFGSVYIAWLSETSALVSLYHHEQACLVLDTLTKSDTYSVMSYKDYKRREDLTSVTQTKPTSSVQKRKQITEVETTHPTKRKKSGSLGETTYSGRSIDTIPEEEEETVTPKKKQKQDGLKVTTRKQEKPFEENIWE